MDEMVSPIEPSSSGWVLRYLAGFDKIFRLPENERRSDTGG